MILDITMYENSEKLTSALAWRRHNFALVMMHYFAPYFSPLMGACKKKRERLRELIQAIVPLINEKRESIS